MDIPYQVEAKGPALVSIGFLIFFSYNAESKGLDQVTEMTATILGISSMAIGFLGCAISIIVSLRAARVMKQFTDKDHDNLVSYFLRAMFVSFLVVVCGVLVKFVKLDCHAPEVLLATLSVACLAYCYRAFHVFGVLVKCSNPARKETR